MTRRKGRAGPDVARGRLRKAVFLVSAALASTLFACAASATVYAEGLVGRGPLVGRLWESIEAGSAIDDVLEKEGIVRIDSENVPEWFEVELIDLEDMDQAIANDSFELVWFLREGSSHDASAFVGERLASKGWAPCEEGEGGIETFVKKEGVCRWVMTECVQAGEEAAIVLRIRHT